MVEDKKQNIPVDYLKIQTFHLDRMVEVKYSLYLLFLDI